MDERRSKLGECLGAGGRASQDETNVAGTGAPSFGHSEVVPERLTEVRHPDGRLSQYPPPELWDDWTEWDGRAWPRRVARRHTLVPTICFNCEAGCGLLAYVDKTTFEIRKFEGNPVHPASRGRNCAKGPATLNQVYDPERILHPLKRTGARGEGKWQRISWDQAIDEIAAKMRKSRLRRRDGIIYHVGRPGEDHYANRVVQAWGVDGHNSHTNVCSAAARTGYALWSGIDRPSPDFAHARCILLLSSHLEAGHYFNPHAQRIVEAISRGAQLVTIDPRLSNTAAKSHVWLPSWPGSEATLLLAIANHLLESGAYDRNFLRQWVNWREFLEHADALCDAEVVRSAREAATEPFDLFERLLRATYAEFTFERAARETRVPEERIREAARCVADAGDRLAAHVWRGASIGNRGGWQVARCLFFLNVLTGSVGTRGGTSLNSWDKFVPRPFRSPPPAEAWNELNLPPEWPLSHYEMSFLLPHFLAEGRGEIDVYFTRVYNPIWTNPDGFVWLQALRDTAKIGCHVALTPTWNETAYFADYVLPMGHAAERHDLMSQETHSTKWIGFRQPVRRVALEREGRGVEHTHQTNPGEVWEEAEFWVELSGKIDPDGALGIRTHFESPDRPGELITQNEYWAWIFENSVPGLPEAAAVEDLSPLQYMRKYGVFELPPSEGRPFEKVLAIEETMKVEDGGRIVDSQGRPIGVRAGESSLVGFDTPSRRLELFSSTMVEWGWPGREYALPWSLPSHVHPSEIDEEAGEMVLLPNFRLPTLIHSRSANSKWLYEISHTNPVWIHPSDARRIGVGTGDLVRVDTEIGYFVDSVWETEAIRPGIVAVSHHLGRWRLDEGSGVSRGSSNLVRIVEEGEGGYRISVKPGAKDWESCDPDTSRIWWKDVGVHQNLAHAVHPDPVSGAHCWLQKALSVRKARDGEALGDVFVDTHRSMEIYREWRALARSASDHSPDGTRRPAWLKRPLRPREEAYRLPQSGNRHRPSPGD